MTSPNQVGLVNSCILQGDVEAPRLPDVTQFCRYLDWDSAFFGYRIARITANRLESHTVGPIMDWCNSQKIDCLYFLADPDDDTTIQLAEENKLHFVDIRATFEKQLDGAPPRYDERCPDQVRVGTQEDIRALRDIARDSYRNTRFYYDKHFPMHLADAL